MKYILCTLLVVQSLNQVSTSNSTSTPCVYRAYSGNSDGCCCYFPFVYQRKTYSSCLRLSGKYFWCATTSSFDVDGKWGYCSGNLTSWSEWSACNTNCITGVQNRTRTCTGFYCPDNLIDWRSCFDNSTCKDGWTNWSEWSDCNATCGNGIKYKNRSCSNKSLLCVGSDIMISNCTSNKSCEGVWSVWSEWSSCNASCGDGVKKKTRVCISENYLCVGDSSNMTNCFDDTACSEDCNKFSKIGQYITAEENILKETRFEVIFMFQNVAFGKCRETSITAGQLQLRFGDDTPQVIQTINCTNSSEKFNYTFSHSYIECGKYEINYSIKPCSVNKSFPDSELFSFMNMTVFCNMSPIQIATKPTSALYPNIFLPKGNEITLEISQSSGSYLIYMLNWGDNVIQEINQSQRQCPIPFYLSHTYKDEGNYTITIEAKNRLQIEKYEIFVQVQNCSFPHISFHYGTKTNPMKILYSANKEFVANFEETQNPCSSANISFDWVLTGSNTENKSQGVLANQKIVYSIRKGDLIYGSYDLSLLLTYNKLTTNYVSYFMVVESPLYVEIENGNFRTVAYKQIQDGGRHHQNFSIRVLVSFDATSPKYEYQGITFKWRCRLVSNISLAFKSLNAYKEVNSTFSSETCFNESWEELSFDGSELLLNTEMFLEGITYQFEVTGIKNVGNYSQYSSFIQEMVFSPGDLPTGNINCLANCSPKLNLRDHVIYLFECSDCGKNQLSFNWEILNDDGNWPPELLLDNSTTTGFKSQTLIINVDTLLESSNYTFILSVGYAGSLYKAFFKFKKQTSSLPVPGSCSISPKQGYAIITKFKLICQNWTDNEMGILRYNFFYDNGAPAKFYLTSNTNSAYPLLNVRSVDNPMLINFVLGAGSPDKNFTINIHVRVIGIYNAYTQYQALDVQVLPYEKAINVSNLFADIGLNDEQNFANLLQAICFVVNEDSKAVYNLNQEISDNTTGLASVNEDLVSKKQNALVQLQNIRTKVVDMLSSTPLNDLNDVKAVGDILSAALGVSEELTPQTKINAVDIVTKMASLLTKDNLKEIGPHVFDIISEPFIVSISNLFHAISYSDNVVESVELKSENSLSTTPANHSSEQQRNKSESVSKLLLSLSDYLNAMQSYTAESEEPIVGDTPAFRFFLKKSYGNDLSNFSSSSSPELQNEETGFTLPNLDSFLNETKIYSSFVVNNVMMKSQPFTWDFERSNNIVSESQILYLSTTMGKKIEVKNLSSAINISIKNIPEKIKGQNLSLLMPNDVQIKFLELKFTDCKLMLKFTPINDPQKMTNLIIYMQYGKVPTKSDYDIRLSVSEKNGTDLVFGNSTPQFDFLKVFDNATSTNLSLSLQRNQKAQLLKDGSLMLWDFQNSTYSFLNKTFLFLSYFYIGPMPEKTLELNSYTYDVKEYQGAYLYEMKSFCVECNYWNETNNKWMSDGCEVDLLANTFSVTKCQCNHLTAFGSFYVAPNLLPTPTLALLKEGYVLLIVVVLVILLWIVGLIIVRRVDKNDIKKIGVCPLLDNRAEDCYLYQITVFTGSRRNAGTKSNIFFTINGEFGDSGVHQLKDSQRVCFQRSSIDVFILATSGSLGDLNYVRLWHDNTGGGWYLRNIEIIDLQTEKQFDFIANRWIAVDQENNLLDFVLPVYGSDDLKSFAYIFSSKTQYGFTEDHLWLSIWTRLPISNFTRCQRLSVAVCLLMTSMTASTMFFGKVPPGSPATENKIGGFTFTWQQIYVSIICASITFPVNILLSQMFRLIKPVYQQTVSEYTNLQQPLTATEKSDLINMEKEFLKKAESKTQKPFYFPHWFLCITWFICIVTILGCGFIVLLFGMSFGNKKSLNWLASVTLGLVNDILFIQPMKIFALAIFTALASKNLITKEKYMFVMQGKTLAHNENWLHRDRNQEVYNRVDVNAAPLTATLLKNMKEARMRQLKIQSIAWELLLYFLFTLLVFFLAYMSRESCTFFQTRDVEELFNLRPRSTPPADNKFQVFGMLQSSDGFWPWMDTFFLPLIYPKPWFNLSERYKGTENMDFPGKLFLPDLTSKIINGIRIRQVRVKHDSCLKAKLVSSFFNLDCLSDYKSSAEETQDFDFNWTTPKKFFSSITPSTMPWRYRTANELDGYPFSAKLELYYGGGYTVEIYPKWINKDMIDELKHRKWIDRQTRAVIIEFALFNAATNHFNMVTIVFELPPFGGMVPYFNVATFKLYTSTTGNAVASIGSQILFIFMMLLFTIRECKLIYRKSWSYFVEFWNLIEVSLIILSLLAVFFFFYRGQLVKQLVQRLPEKQPQKFINFQFASYWDLTYTYIVSLIVFFVNLKFLKLLRFNRRISLLACTLRVALFPLSMLGITFVLILFAVMFSANLAFGVLLDGYQTYFQTIASVVSLLLGKFSFYQFVNANSVLGPIFFFGFNILMNWIFMNMFISILNDSFRSVRLNIGLQSNDYEIIEYFIDRFKGWLGLNVNNRDSAKSPLNTGHTRSLVRSSSSLERTSSTLSDYWNKEIDVEHNENVLLCLLEISSYEHILKEQNDEDIMNKLRDKFIDCLNIVYVRNSLETMKN